MNSKVKYFVVPFLLIVIAFLLIDRGNDKVDVTKEEVMEAMDLPNYDKPHDEPHDKPNEQPKSKEEPSSKQEPPSIQDEDYYYNLNQTFLLIADGVNKISYGIEYSDFGSLQEGVDTLLFTSNEIYSMNPPSDAKEVHEKVISLATVNERIAYGVQSDIDTGVMDYLNSPQFIEDLDEAIRINDEITFMSEEQGEFSL